MTVTVQVKGKWRARWRGPSTPSLASCIGPVLSTQQGITGVFVASCRFTCNRMGPLDPMMRPTKYSWVWRPTLLGVGCGYAEFCV